MLKILLQVDLCPVVLPEVTMETVNTYIKTHLCHLKALSIGYLIHANHSNALISYI